MLSAAISLEAQRCRTHRSCTAMSKQCSMALCSTLLRHEPPAQTTLIVMGPSLQQVVQHCWLDYLCNKLFSIVSLTIIAASRILRHWCRSRMTPQRATLCRLRRALFERGGHGCTPLPRGHVPGQRCEEKQSFETVLYSVDLRRLQQLHGVHHEGVRLSSTVHSLN